MKVKVTYPMLKLLKNALPDYSVSLVKMPIDLYRAMVDFDEYSNYKDYSYKTEKFSVIRIDYPAEYYAMPQYLTTNILSKIFRSSDHTMNGFIDAVKAYCEI